MALQARLWYNRSMKILSQSATTNSLWRDVRKVTSHMNAIVPPSEKLCFRCKTVKPASDFARQPRSKDGLHSYCKPCLWQWRSRDKENTPEGSRKCVKCQEVKPLEEFYRNKSAKEGYGWECKPCCKARMNRMVSLSDVLTSKKCSICHESKSFDDFDKDKRTSDGLHPYCKKCGESYRKIKVRPDEEVPSGFKRCLRCGEIKAASFYTPRQKNSDGLYSYCKECSNNGKRKRYVTELPQEKTCTHCKKTKPADEFYIHNGNSKDGLSTWCKDCTKTDARERGQRTYSVIGSRRTSLRSLYGLTLNDYEHMYQEQDGKCAACGKPETTMMRGRLVSLAVDHSRETGKVRGLLCQKCNQALGLLLEDTERIKGLLKYAEERVKN